MAEMTPYAPALYRALNGIFCVYKPSGVPMQRLLRNLKMKFSNDLNQMEIRPPRPILKYNLEDKNLPTITTVPDLADHPLVVGPRYLEEDFEIGFVDALKTHSSGVLVMGVGLHGRKRLPVIARNMYMRVYQVKGQLGLATDNFTVHGRLVEKSTYYHVTQTKIDRILAAMQAGHQKAMFVGAKIDPQSQEAYDLAVTGLIRPADRKAGAMVYGMKCIDFEPPHFTLEIHSINERCDYLSRMVHELGLEMKTNAVCNQIRRLRYGHFNLQHALLSKHWDPENVAENIRFCRPLVDAERLQRQKQILPTEKVEVPLIEGEVPDDMVRLPTGTVDMERF